MNLQGEEYDFATKRRLTYIITCVIGSMLSYYCRSLFYKQTSHSFEGCEDKIFNHPWFGTLVMAFGMTLCFFVYVVTRIFNPDVGPPVTQIPLGNYLYACLPAMCDLLYSVLYSFSIISSSGEISVALRYFEFLFILILNRVVFKPTYYNYMRTSIIIVFVGIACVTVSVLISSHNVETNWAFIVVVILQIFAQFCHAGKTTFEQKLMHNNDLSPWWLAGVEGIYQLFVMFFMFNPLSYLMPAKGEFSGLREDFCEAITMVCHSKTIMVLFAVYTPIACIYNGTLIGAIMVTNGISYTLVEMIGTSIAWIIDIIIFHGFDGKFILPSGGYVFGVKWTDMSYLRLIGSFIFFFGLLIFIKVIRFKCFVYEDPNVKIVKIEDYSNKGKNNSDELTIVV